jgi:hypothetical protein
MGARDADAACALRDDEGARARRARVARGAMIPRVGPRAGASKTTMTTTTTMNDFLLDDDAPTTRRRRED